MISGDNEIVRKILYKIFHFDEWHLGVPSKRPYFNHTVRKVNEILKSYDCGCVVEVGCGLGDIINKIEWSEKYGYDIEANAIHAARFLYPKVFFYEGSFDAVKNKNIRIIIALNFLHRLDDEECKKAFENLIHENKVERIVVDELTEGGGYRYIHNYKNMFLELDYVLEYRSRGFLAAGKARRHILYFKKRDKWEG